MTVAPTVISRPSIRLSRPLSRRPRQSRTGRLSIPASRRIAEPKSRSSAEAFDPVGGASNSASRIMRVSCPPRVRRKWGVPGTRTLHEAIASAKKPMARCTAGSRPFQSFRLRGKRLTARTSRRSQEDAHAPYSDHLLFHGGRDVGARGPSTDLIPH
jgi:hypothetical protein